MNEECFENHSTKSASEIDRQVEEMAQSLKLQGSHKFDHTNKRMLQKFHSQTRKIQKGMRSMIMDKIKHYKEYQMHYFNRLLLITIKRRLYIIYEDNYSEIDVDLILTDCEQPMNLVDLYREKHPIETDEELIESLMELIDDSMIQLKREKKGKKSSNDSQTQAETENPSLPLGKKKRPHVSLLEQFELFKKNVELKNQQKQIRLTSKALRTLAKQKQESESKMVDNKNQQNDQIKLEPKPMFVCQPDRGSQQIKSEPPSSNNQSNPANSIKDLLSCTPFAEDIDPIWERKVQPEVKVKPDDKNEIPKSEMKSTTLVEKSKNQIKCIPLVENRRIDKPKFSKQNKFNSKKSVPNWTLGPNAQILDQQLDWSSNTQFDNLPIIPQLTSQQNLPPQFVQNPVYENQISNSQPNILPQFLTQQNVLYPNVPNVGNPVLPEYVTQQNEIPQYVSQLSYPSSEFVDQHSPMCSQNVTLNTILPNHQLPVNKQSTSQNRILTNSSEKLICELKQGTHNFNEIALKIDKTEDEFLRNNKNGTISSNETKMFELLKQEFKGQPFFDDRILPKGQNKRRPSDDYAHHNAKRKPIFDPKYSKVTSMDKNDNDERLKKDTTTGSHQSYKIKTDYKIVKTNVSNKEEPQKKPEVKSGRKCSRLFAEYLKEWNQGNVPESTAKRKVDDDRTDDNHKNQRIDNDTRDSKRPRYMFERHLETQVTNKSDVNNKKHVSVREMIDSKQPKYMFERHLEPKFTNKSETQSYTHKKNGSDNKMDNSLIKPDVNHRNQHADIESKDTKRPSYMFERHLEQVTNKSETQLCSHRKSISESEMDDSLNNVDTANASDSTLVLEDDEGWNWKEDYTDWN